MQAHILIVEDEKEINDLICLYLSREGAVCRQAESGEEGFAFFQKENFDLVLLDINLPGIDGFDFLKKLREKNDVPVIIVSARQDDADIVLGLGIGADDFVVKPFSPSVLVARVRARLRRAVEGVGKNAVRFGDFVLEAGNYLLKRGGSRVALSPREFSLLCLLAENPGLPIKSADIYEKVWGNAYGDTTTVAVHIQRLRRKIEDNPDAPRFIKTVFGFGYVFDRDGEI
ncbi:MAG: response regulator transcription factor [Spirochaetales bacterium]|jgi:two-component system response regulator RegX3|nr:response regulator transcription factor [Spirochaetales bacterium]